MDLALRALRRNHYRKVLRITARFRLSLHLAAAPEGSLLHIAVARDQFESARALLQAGADATSTASQFAETPLHLVRSVRVAQLLIENGAVDAIADKTGKTPFTNVMRGPAAVPLLRCLAAGGLDVNARGQSYDTPLHYLAARHIPHSRDLMRILLDHGADPNAVDSNGATPVDLALLNGNFLELAPPLLSAGGRWRSASPLHAALLLRTGACEALELALSYGADTECKEYGATALHCSRELQEMRILLRAGANPNALYLGQTLLDGVLMDQRPQEARPLAAALILAGGRLSGVRTQRTERAITALTDYWGITEATADWRAAVWKRCTAEERLSFRLVVKLP